MYSTLAFFDDRVANMEFDYLAYIDELKEEVQINFDRIITAANLRLTSMLQRLTNLAEKYRRNQVIIEEELERISSLLEDSKKTSNLNEFDEKMRVVQKKREALTELTSVEYVSVKWNHKCLEVVSNHGNMLVERGILYSSRFENRTDTCLTQSIVSLLEPICLVIDSTNQQLCLLDSTNCCVAVFSREGEFIRKFGQGLLSIWGGMDEPKGISIRDGRVFVTQSQGHCIKEYNLDGTLKRKVGSRGCSPREFNTPLGLDTDLSNIFICDCLNNRIQILDYKLQFVKRFTGTSIKFPRQLKVLENRIFVLTSYETCIQEIDKQEGSWIRSIITLDSTAQVSKISFTFDKARSLFLCNPATHSVSVFSHNSMQVLYTSKFSENRELLCVTSSNGDVYVVARERETSEVHCIRI